MRTSLSPGIVAAGLVLVLLVACMGAPPAATGPASKPGAPAAKLPLKFGWQPSADFIFYGARAAQLFEEVGLSPEYVQFPSGREMLAAMQSKSIDVAQAAHVPLISALAQDLDVKVVFVFEDSTRNVGLLARPSSGIQAVTDLAGKRVAYTKGSSAQYSLSKALASANMSPDQLTWVDVNADKAFPAFLNGDVDAWYVWSPWFYKAQTEGGKVITTDKDLGLSTPAVYFARTEWLAQNPEAAKRLLQAVRLSIERLQQDHSAAVKAAAQTLAIPEEMAAQVYDRAYRPPITEQLDETSYISLTSPAGLAEILDDIVGYLYDQKLITKRPDVTKAIDPGPMRAAMQASR